MRLGRGDGKTSRLERADAKGGMRDRAIVSDQRALQLQLMDYYIWCSWMHVIRGFKKLRAWICHVVVRSY